METIKTNITKAETTGIETAGTDTAKTGNRKTLLIIDDAEADRKIYRRYLQKDSQQQYDLCEVSCAREGLTLFSQQSFDIVLLDFQLPDMNGLDVLSRMQAEAPTVAVIMLTGHGDEEVAVRAIKGGAQDYLVKDRLKEDTFQRTVRNVITQQQLRQRLQKTEEQQRLITQMAFQIRRSLELEKTLETAVREVRSLLKCDRVLAYQFAADMSGQIIAESVGPGWTKTLGERVEDTFFQQQGATDYCQGRKQIVANIHDGTLNDCHVALLEQFEVKAILVVPVLIGPEHLSATPQQSNRLWGLIVAHQCATVRTWQTDEVRMLETLSIHCAIAIQHAELLATTRAALKKEQALNLFKSQIIATVSHEYNSPLTAIQAAAGLLHAHEKSLDEPTRERLLDIITRKSKHMSALVNNMLLVHRSELDERKITLTTLDLGDFLSKLISEQQITTQQHRLMLKIRGDVNEFKGDLGLLQQIFSNLLSNAIKYSPEGGDIQIYLIGEATQVICSINDEGIGITEKDQGKLFQAFSRGSNVGSITGTGLGLKIVKTAVNLHNGSIEVLSQEGKGTQFRVYLPK